MKKQFFNKTLNLFKNHNISNKKMILAVSGGVDSIVLLDLLKELSSPCKLELCVLHIHHGRSDKKHITTYRDEAKSFVFHLSSLYKLRFLCPNRPKTKLESEEDFRKFRLSHFEKLLKQNQADIISLAHNKNDLLETQLIHLIRGCGKEGLTGIKIWDSPYLRPLLMFSRQDILNYALQQKLKWKEDPSNKNSQYLRNWIRNKWLPSLETKRPGAVKSLARSLEAVCLSHDENAYLLAVTPQGIKRDLFMEMSYKEQKRVLAYYMRQLKLSNYGQSHIGEILKQADRKEKKFSLKILKKTWIFTTKYISTK